MHRVELNTFLHEFLQKSFIMDYVFGTVLNNGNKINPLDTFNIVLLVGEF